jgi:hypothetical protein
VYFRYIVICACSHQSLTPMMSIKQEAESLTLKIVLYITRVWSGRLLLTYKTIAIIYLSINTRQISVLIRKLILLKSPWHVHARLDCSKSLKKNHLQLLDIYREFYIENYHLTIIKGNTKKGEGTFSHTLCLHTFTCTQMINQWHGLPQVIVHIETTGNL